MNKYLEALRDYVDLCPASPPQSGLCDVDDEGDPVVMPYITYVGVVDNADGLITLERIDSEGRHLIETVDTRGRYDTPSHAQGQVLPLGNLTGLRAYDMFVGQKVLIGLAEGEIIAVLDTRTLLLAQGRMVMAISLDYIAGESVSVIVPRYKAYGQGTATRAMAWFAVDMKMLCRDPEGLAKVSEERDE